MWWACRSAKPPCSSVLATHCGGNSRCPLRALWSSCTRCARACSARLPTRPHACTPASLLPLTAHQAYEPHIFWWELLEIGRKFFLVAVAVTFGPGTVMQLVWGILVTVTFLCLRFEAQPYRSSAADHLAFSVDVFLVMVSRAIVSRAIVRGP